MVVTAAVSTVSTKHGRYIWSWHASWKSSNTCGRQHAAVNPALDALATSTSAKSTTESFVVVENLVKLISNRTNGAVNGDEYGRWFLRRHELWCWDGAQPEGNEPKLNHAFLQPVCNFQPITPDTDWRDGRKHAVAYTLSLLANAQLS